MRKKSANRKLGKQALESIGLNLFVTNVGRETCTASQVYELYTLRWQIELVFKTWKSIIKIHQLHAMNALRMECVLLMRLIWAMLNWAIFTQIRDVLGQNVSLHKFTQTLHNRSAGLSWAIMQDKEQLYSWLVELCKISNYYHIKEYKKGKENYLNIMKILVKNEV